MKYRNDKWPPCRGRSDLFVFKTVGVRFFFLSNLNGSVHESSHRCSSFLEVS